MKTSSKKSYKIRFHLSKGKNFMKWQVKSLNGDVSYHDPLKVQLKLLGCVLKNQASTSKRIFLGAEKVVCAWVECDAIIVMPLGMLTIECPLKFNPRVAPNWLLRDKVVDGQEFDVIVSSNRGLYTNH